MFNSFLESVTVLDTESTSLNIQEAEIIELGVCTFSDNNWSSVGRLFRSSKPILPECSAICHISNRMVQDKELFADSLEDVLKMINLEDTNYYATHNVRFDQALLTSNFKRAGVDIDFKDILGSNNWICTMRLAKIFLAGESPASFGQQYLRYYFDLDIDEGTPHRAAYDAYVCGHLLQKLVEVGISKGFVNPNLDIGNQLVKLCWQPKEITEWPFGKHKGKAFKDLPNDFLKWAILNIEELDEKSYRYDYDLSTAVIKEIEQRPSFKV